MTNNKINLGPFLNPSEKIITSVSKLILFYQLINQGKVKVFIKKGHQDGFKGTLKEFNDLEEIKELYANEGKPWEHLIKAVHLLDNYSTEFNVRRLLSLTNQEILQTIQIIKEGVASQKTLSDWIKPLTTRNEIITAIKDAVKINFKNQFQILKLADIKSLPNPDNKISLMNEILEIDSPSGFINYIKHRKKPFHDSLVLTVKRNPKFDFRGTFYIFLIYKNSLYSIDNAERRLNLDNTEGCRNPDRYIERKYANTWLPINLLFYEKSQEAEQFERIPIPYGTKIYRIATFENIFKEEPEIIYWLNMFTYKIMEHIETEEIQQGITQNSTIKLLELKNHNEPDNIKFECNDLKGKGAYLLKKYKDTVSSKSLVVKLENIPELIGTERYISDLIAYKKRDQFADEIQKSIIKEFEENKDRVAKWLKTFLKGQDVSWLIIRALEDKEYPWMKYPRFTEKRKIFLKHSTILSLREHIWSSDSDSGKDFCYTDKLYDWSSNTICACCNKFKWKLLIILTFKDHRQFIGFFQLKAHDVPSQIIDHLHQQGEMYEGNTILNDIDPIDRLIDPWFRRKDTGSIIKFADQEAPYIRFIIPVCKICLNKYQKKAQQTAQ